jgi:hypothetical protein
MKKQNTSSLANGRIERLLRQKPDLRDQFVDSFNWRQHPLFWRAFFHEHPSHGVKVEN